MQATSIEWTDLSFNAIRSRRTDTGRLGHHCIKLSPGCANCYSGVWNGWRGNGLPFTAAAAEKAGMFLDRDVLQKLLRRRKPARVFVCDMTDLFGDWVPDEWLDAIYAAMLLCRHMTFQVLTKRAGRMHDYLRQVSDERDMQRWGGAACDLLGTPDALGVFDDAEWPPPNIWHGVSVEDRKHGLPRVEVLRDTPAAVRFLSVEPLLEDLGDIDLTGIHWVIVGGESGHGARPMHPDWARSIRDQCQAAGVAYFHKQNGEWLPVARPTDADEIVWACRDYPRGRWLDVDGSDKHGSWDTVMLDRVGKKAAGRLLDGRTWDEFPAALAEAPAS